LESIPDQAARDLGADIIVAVDLLSDISDSRSFNGKNNPSIVEVVQRTSILAQRKITEYKFKENPPDILIQPPLSNVKIMDFHHGESVIEVGREAAKKVLPDLLDKIT